METELADGTRDDDTDDDGDDDGAPGVRGGVHYFAGDDGDVGVESVDEDAGDGV